jgi:hypothetical protein
MHLAPIPGLGAATGCTDVSLHGTISQHRFLPGASSTFTGLYPGSC